MKTSTKSKFENGMDHFMTVNIKCAAPVSPNCDLKIIKSHASRCKLITGKDQEKISVQKQQCTVESVHKFSLISSASSIGQC